MPITVIPAPDNSGMMQGLQNLLAVLMQLRQEDIRKKERAEETGMEQAKNLINVIGSVAGEDIGTREAKTAALNENPDLLRRALGISEIGSPVATGVEGFAGIGGAVPKVTTKRVIGGAGKTAGDVKIASDLAEQARADEYLTLAKSDRDFSKNTATLSAYKDFEGATPAELYGFLSGKAPAPVGLKPRNPMLEGLGDLADKAGVPRDHIYKMYYDTEFAERLKGIKLENVGRDKSNQIAVKQLRAMDQDYEINQLSLNAMRAGINPKTGKPLTGELSDAQREFTLDMSKLTSDARKSIGLIVGPNGQTIDPEYHEVLIDPQGVAAQAGFRKLLDFDPSLATLSGADLYGPEGLQRRILAAIRASYKAKTGKDMTEEEARIATSILAPSGTDKTKMERVKLDNNDKNALAAVVSSTGLGGANIDVYNLRTGFQGKPPVNTMTGVTPAGSELDKRSEAIGQFSNLIRGR